MIITALKILTQFAKVNGAEIRQKYIRELVVINGVEIERHASLNQLLHLNWHNEIQRSCISLVLPFHW